MLGSLSTLLANRLESSGEVPQGRDALHMDTGAENSSFFCMVFLAT
jgi:hypothetical protein